MNKMIIHYCGGAGINISRHLNQNLSELGSGYCEVTAKYIDTSTNNMGNIPLETLWRVTAAGFSEAGVDGSGGERRTNSASIMDSVKSYLDTNKHKELVTGEFHIVVFSAAGGTGSVVAPALISNLRTRNIPVIGIMIGDSGNGLSCKNTLNTIATLDHMAKRTVKRPITMMYYNNHTADGGGVGKREGTVNQLLFNALSVLSLFLSGDNEDIDTKDMINFISPDNYSTITIEPSLYCINIHTGNSVANDPEVINLIGRTLTTAGNDANIGLTLLQHKYGKIVSPDALNAFGKLTPVNMLLVGNYLSAEHGRLAIAVDEYANIASSIKTDDLHGVGEADESGMIF